MGPALNPRRLVLKLLTIAAVAVASTVAVSLAWIAIGGGPLGLHGLIALSLGVTGVVALAWSLMALAFRSSRDGWDERADRPTDFDKS